MASLYRLLVALIVLPMGAEAIEFKVDSNLAGSMPKVTLTNATIFPTEMTVSIFETELSSFVLDAHSTTELFVECHTTGPNKAFPVGISTESEAWSETLEYGNEVAIPRAIWISSQRQGRAHIESLMREQNATLRLTHLSLAQAPLHLAEIDQVGMILISAGDLERLDANAFAIIEQAVTLGATIVISARETSPDSLSKLSRLTDARFGEWIPVSEAVSVKLPAVTRVASINSPSTDQLMAIEQTSLLTQNSYGFGRVRLVAVPFANLREGMVNRAAFEFNSSRLLHPMQWLSSHLAPAPIPFFLSIWVPLSGFIFCLLVFWARNHGRVASVGLLVWWIVMFMQPIADKGLEVSGQTGIQMPLADGGAVLMRLDVDHRLGGGAVFEKQDFQVDFQALRAGTACLVHHGESTHLVFPPSAERMTRLFLAFRHQTLQKERPAKSVHQLGDYPRDDLAGAQLSPIEAPAFKSYCREEICEFYQINRASQTGG